MSEEFFVGYQKVMPVGIAAFLRRRVLGLFAVAVALGAVLVTAQKGFAPSVFEFGRLRAFTGTLSEHPYPTLLVPRPGHEAGYSRYYLVAPGKRGAEPLVQGFDGQRVALEGTLIYRGAQTMIEIAPDSLRPASQADISPFPNTEDLGTHTLVGEIVDSKCYLGVMKPGHLKPHRSCAIRCISGGIPPVLLVRDKDGLAEYFMLVGPDGRTVNQDVLPLVAEPVEITGRVERHDNLLVLKSDPRTYRRIR